MNIYGIKQIFTLATLSLLCILPGCTEPASCDWHQEADTVAATWEAYYGDELTDEQYACLHNFEVRVTDEDRTLCGNEDNVGCTRSRLISGRMVISIHEGLHPTVRTLTQRHELHHLLLHCMGNMDVHHEHPSFAGDGKVTNPNALAMLAYTVETPSQAVCAQQ